MTLHLKNLSKHFGGVHAVSNVSFKIQEGKITAIIGPNGSGKTTLFHTISGLYSADSGTIHFNSKEITNTSPSEIARLGISRTFQEVRLFKNLTIKDHLEIAMLQDDEKLLKNFFSKAHDTSRMHGILKLVHLNKPLETCATDLSYGQRKLLDLAVAIAKPHTLLMLDEPVAGVNPQLRKEIREILLDLNRKGETIIVIEHDMNFVMGLADHIIVMDEGKLLVEGKPKDIQDNRKVLEAYLGD